MPGPGGASGLQKEVGGGRVGGAEAGPSLREPVGDGGVRVGCGAGGTGPGEVGVRSSFEAPTCNRRFVNSFFQKRKSYDMNE